VGIVVLLLLLSHSAGPDTGISQYNPINRASCAFAGSSCHKRRAISTILTGPSFLPGVVTLAYSISKHASTTVDKVIILPSDWSSHGFTADHIQTLERVGFTLKLFDDLPLPMSADGKDGLLMDSRYAEVLLKLRAWSLTEYSAIAMLDADMLLNDSLKYPFDLLEASDANLAAVAAPSYGPTAPFYDMLSGHFNAGTLVLKPDLAVYASLVDKSSRREEYGTLELPEQSFLNTQYAGTHLALPARYNVANTPDRKDYFKRFVLDSDWDFAVLHFLGGLDLKPWSGSTQSNKDGQKGVDMWREEYRQAKEKYGLYDADLA
jgi:hypothetical protein